jgi:hypothetical protein
MILSATLSVVVLIGMATRSHTTQQAQRIVGDLWLTGAVTVNGTPVTSGIAVFDRNQVKTARNSSATVNLGKWGRIKLEPESEMMLQLASGLIGGNQLSGLSAISANNGVKTRVTTPHVRIEADGTEVSLVSIEVQPQRTCVVANRGSVRLTAGPKVSTLGPGQALSFNAAGAEKNNLCEGLKASSSPKPLAMAGAVTAATLIPLTIDAVASARGVVVTPRTTPNEVVPQSSPPPTSNNTSNPTTPVKPPPPFSVCNCKYDKYGEPLSLDQRVMIRHVLPNGRCQTLTLDCKGLLGHFNLNGTPRANHAQDECSMCS